MSHFKHSRISKRKSGVGVHLKYSQKIILQIAFLLGVFLLLVYLLVIFERNSNQSSLVDFENALWFGFVTVSTVGYGDIFPVTLYGRFVALILILCSLGVYGLLIGGITSLMNTYKENQRLGYQGTTFSDHAVILGWDEIARNVVDQLVGVYRKVAIVTDDMSSVNIIRELYEQYKRYIYVLHSDYASIEAMRRANFESAAVIFLNFESDMDKLVYVLNTKKLLPRKKFVVILNNASLRNAFKSAGVMYAVAKNEIASKILASYIFEPDVAEYSEDILSYAEGDMDYDIKQYRLTPENPYRDREYQYAFFDMKKRFNAVLIGVGRSDSSGKRILVKNPSGSLKLEVGDYLIMILNGRSSKEVLNMFKVNEGV